MRKNRLEVIYPVVLVVLGFTLFVFIRNVFGDAAPVPQPADIPAVGTGILATLRAWGSFVPQQWLITIIAVGLELLGRIIPTKKPWSLLYFARDLCCYLAIILNTLASLLDKVLVQQTNPPDAANPPPKI